MLQRTSGVEGAARATEEVEFKLAVIGSDPEAILHRIESLERIADWQLGPPIRHAIRDVYWDSPDGALGRKKITLRLRDLDGRPLLTTKGGGRSDRGLFRRQELELPATASNWREIRDSMMARGVPLRAGQAADDDEPSHWLEQAGLMVTQDRLTERTVRFATTNGQRVAELALDFTTYRFGTHLARFREVEIERLGGADDVARVIGEQLLALFPRELTPSKLGKYARGRRIERILRARGFQAGPLRRS